MAKDKPIIIPPGSSHPLDISKQLIEKENQEAREMVARHIEKLKRVRDGLIELMVKEDFNWGDWGAVIEMMNDKSKAYFPKITIKDLTNYGK